MRSKQNQTTPAHLRWYFTKRLALMTLGAGIALFISSHFIPDNPIAEVEEARVTRMIASSILKVEDEQEIGQLIAATIDKKRRATAHTMAAWGVVLAVAGLGSV